MKEYASPRPPRVVPVVCKESHYANRQRIKETMIQKCTQEKERKAKLMKNGGKSSKE